MPNLVVVRLWCGKKSSSTYSIGHHKFQYLHKSSPWGVCPPICAFYKQQLNFHGRQCTSTYGKSGPGEPLGSWNPKNRLASMKSGSYRAVMG